MQTAPMDPIPKMVLGRPHDIPDPTSYRASSLLLTDLSGMPYMNNNNSMKIPKSDLYLADNFSEDVIPLATTEPIQTKMEML